MNKLILVAITLLISTAALAGVSGHYSGYDMDAIIVEQDGAIAFDISSQVGQNTCSLTGTAKTIDDTRAVYTPDDAADTCVAVISFAPGSLKVTTKGCESKCGMNAAGSMDGMYMKK